MTEIPYQEWVDALRSGKYKQTKETLKGELPEGGVGYCCLGVLADIMGYEIEVETYIGGGEWLKYETEGPKHIYEDFKASAGGDFVDLLMRHNDNGMPFRKISDIIEREMGAK